MTTFKGVPVDDRGGATVDGLLTIHKPSILSLPHGLHRGVPESVYHERVFGLVSKSALDLVAKSPAHLKEWWDGASEEPTAAMRFGTALHCAALTPAIYEETYAVEPEFGDCRKTAPKAARDMWRAENAGRQTISLEDASAIRRMVAKLHAHPLVACVLDGGDTELTMRWQDSVTDLECRGRVDAYHRDSRVALDLKTTTDATPEGFSRSVENYRYHVQEGMYRRGLAACRAPVDVFRFVAIEKLPPYRIRVHTLDPYWRIDGFDECERDMNAVARAIEFDAWEDQDQEESVLSRPAWAKRIA